MKNSKTRDLASGPLLLQIIIFSIPLIASGVLQQLFNSCDIAVVGRFVGPEALAAVGSTAPLINLVLNIFMGLSVGANVLIASLDGQKKYKAISSAVHTFEIFGYFIVSAFVQCAVTFSSQNYGAGNLPRCRKSYYYCMFLGVSLTMICSIVFTIFRWPLSEIYSKDPEAVRYCAERILKVELFQFLVNSYEITSGALRGLGCSLLPALITIVGTCSLRLCWIALVFPKSQTYETILAVYPISWTVTGIAMITAYAIFTRKKFETQV